MRMPVVYFETTRGERPVDLYMESLPLKDRVKIKALKVKIIVRKERHMRTGGHFHKTLEKDLKDPAFRMLFVREKTRLNLSEKLQKALRASRLSIRALADLIGTSKSQIERMIGDPTANIGIDSLLKFVAATGKKIQIDIK